MRRKHEKKSESNNRVTIEYRETFQKGFLRTGR